MTTSTVPMIAPDGSHWDIPHEKVQDALNSGGKVGQNMIAPDGSKWLIPIDKVQDALKNGGTFDKEALGKQFDEASDNLSKKAPAMAGIMAGGGGLQEVGEEAAGAIPAAKQIAKKIYQHVLDYFGAGEKAEGAVESGEAAAEAKPSEPAPKEATSEPAKPAPTPRPRLRALSDAPKKETAEEFVDRLMPKPDTYRVHVGDKVVDVPEPSDAPLSEEVKAKIAEQMKGKYEPEIHKRGPMKGQPKTVRVFQNGQWHEVQKYAKAADE